MHLVASQLRFACLLSCTLGFYFVAIARSDDTAEGFTPAEPTTAKELFGQTIRASNQRAPLDELEGFHVPEGFQIELIAAEPLISKPMNMAFDSAGRLWLTQSTQYPFPAKEGETGTDAIVILEDTDHNGTFEKSHVFADGLNIPIGMLPFGDGALCFSIPNLLYLRDTDNDGVCDRREVVLGPFDTPRDTHGMVNSLRMGEDGWVYACHGFNNQSRIQGTDGHAISMTSGNVFRFRPDGSRVELFSQGQVNPFGLARDRWGFWYAADCHSKPISQLILGGCHPSFGRPDDGLGFVPPMMDHLHGSTAIAGLVHTKDSRFPIPFQDNFLSGNVMTCRINRNRIEYHGATAKAVALPDLLTSDDPWFRPVDLQFGPDGHLYIADFYNKVIGHYEVPLDHPGRDRTSGRIWRLKWTGDKKTLVPEPSREIVRDANKPTIDQLDAAKPMEAKKVLARWISWLENDISSQGMSYTERDQLLRFGDALDLTTEHHRMLLQSLAEIISSPYAGSSNPSIATVPADAAAQKSALTPDWLVRQTSRIDSARDPVLMQSVLIALRSTLLELRTRDTLGFEALIDRIVGGLKEPKNGSAFSIDAAEVRAVTRVLLAMNDPTSTSGVLTLVEKQAASRESTADQKRIVEELTMRLADVVDDSKIDRLVSLMESSSNNFHSTADQFLRIAQRQQQQRGKVLGNLKIRGQSMLAKLSDEWLANAAISTNAAKVGEANSVALIGTMAVSEKKEERREWGVENRMLSMPTNKKAEPGRFFSSLTLGETYTGTWTSAPFIAPNKLRFYVVGHNGLPSTPDHNKNYVCLVSLDASGSVIDEIARVSPPRSDVATFVEWDLADHRGQDHHSQDHRGQSVQLQVVDGDSASSYAWIGFGECDLTGLNPGPLRNQWQRIVSFADSFGWPDDASQSTILSKLLTSDLADWSSRFQLNKQRYKKECGVAIELIEFATERHWMDLVSDLGGGFRTMETWDLRSVPQEKIRAIAASICKRCSFKDQERLVGRLSKHRESIELMGQLCANGSLSRDSLRALPSNFWESLPSDGSVTLVGLRPEAATPSARQSVVESKATAIAALKPDLQIGAKLFAERCALCHKLGDQGKVIGPQLEGVGSRGIARLCEDILWPDRNVDEAFHITLLALENGESLSGLVTERTADSLMFTDQTGKQRRILVADIEQEKQSKLSLMPGNFEETMTNDELAALIGFLRKQAGIKTPAAAP